MFSKLFNCLKWSKRLLSTIPTPGDGLGFVQSGLHKDNIKIVSLISGALIVGSGLVLQGGFVSYKVLENAKAMKDLEIKIGEKLEINAKENAKAMKDLERVIVSQFLNLQTAMISVMASSSNRRPDEIVDALRHDKNSDVTSNSNGDNH